MSWVRDICEQSVSAAREEKMRKEEV